MSVVTMDGRTIDGAVPGANVDLVEQLRIMLAEAEAGRLVVWAGVVGSTEKGKLELRFAIHSNNWEVHDRLLARVGILRAMMERDYLDKMSGREGYISGGNSGDDGDDAA